MKMMIDGDETLVILMMMSLKELLCDQLLKC